jgi:hypothetical protein
MTSTSHEDKYAYSYMIISCLLLIKNLYRKSKHTYYAQKLFFGNSAFYEITWKKHGRAE